MNSDPRYALEKLSLAEYELAVGPGDVRSRLRSAYKYLSPIFKMDFPPELQDDWLHIQNQLNTRTSKWQGTEFDEGSFRATLNRMRNSTGSKIAARIIDLKYRIEDWLEDHD